MCVSVSVSAIQDGISAEQNQVRHVELCTSHGKRNIDQDKSTTDTLLNSLHTLHKGKAMDLIDI